MQALKTLSDDQLQSLLADGNYDAFTVLYTRYASPIQNYLLKLLNSKALSEDICQEVFIKIWQGRNKVSGISSFKAYLFTVARNHGIDSLKAAFKNEAATGEVIKSFIEQRNPTEDDMLTKEYLIFIENVLNGIPSRSREIFLLCRENCKTYDEVAKGLGISRNAVKNHMVYTMKILRSAAENELGISLSVLLVLLLKR